jgi:hypothetical protein
MLKGDGRPCNSPPLKNIALRAILYRRSASGGHDSLCDQGVRARFARKAKLENASLIQAAEDVTAGRHAADLGGGVFKQRVARAGGGKSGGFRTIILFRVGGHCFFAHGFAKSDKANVSAKELKASDAQIRTAQTDGELIEVVSDDNGKQKS